MMLQDAFIQIAFSAIYRIYLLGVSKCSPDIPSRLGATKTDTSARLVLL